MRKDQADGLTPAERQAWLAGQNVRPGGQGISGSAELARQRIGYVARLVSHPTYESVPGYWRRHEDAMMRPRGIERPIAGMLHAWLLYADLHRERFESGIGQDYVLGPEWAKIGAAIRGLLNGDCGRIDCGAVDSVIEATLKDEGFDPDTL